ncbi:hypothetical protein ASPBRDRAFT_42155 [Aspergillus brasiliensis CBS 101740]|uniref:Uncharacterized protein n=1 Tax=Aspergillus brasiliensis (strain CBS 101740 / IMI 381727 / IBT 21946) TaxID=767769 RepID=A0A1L9UL71_ASPBC|nr:hypothetical protein ASPBRDRAFT_42155 [Aspergillus brasiliensis CBS 101740]
MFVGEPWISCPAWAITPVEGREITELSLTSNIVSDVYLPIEAHVGVAPVASRTPYIHAYKKTLAYRQRMIIRELS